MFIEQYAIIYNDINIPSNFTVSIHSYIYYIFLRYIKRYTQTTGGCVFWLNKTTSVLSSRVDFNAHIVNGTYY